MKKNMQGAEVLLLVIVKSFQFYCFVLFQNNKFFGCFRLDTVWRNTNTAGNTITFFPVNVPIHASLDIYLSI